MILDIVEDRVINNMKKEFIYIMYHYETDTYFYFKNNPKDIMNNSEISNFISKQTDLAVPSREIEDLFTDWYIKQLSETRYLLLQQDYKVFKKEFNKFVDNFLSAKKFLKFSGISIWRQVLR